MIDLSIKKDFDHPVELKEIYNSLIMEANLLISNNYIEDKIIHIITTKSIIDGSDYLENFKNDKKIKSIIVEIKFLCLNFKNLYLILKFGPFSLLIRVFFRFLLHVCFFLLT